MFFFCYKTKIVDSIINNCFTTSNLYFFLICDCQCWINSNSNYSDELLVGQ